MKTLLLLGSLFTLAALPVSAAVKVDMKAGLWQNTVRLTGGSAAEMQQLQTAQMQQAMADMKKQLANMPEEQRKQIEAMMGPSGMKLDDSAITAQIDALKNGTSSKSCVTQAEIDRGELPDENLGDNCTSTLTQVSATQVKSTEVCTGENPSRGEMNIVFDSPKHYTGKGVMTQTVNGQAHSMELHMDGQWLGSDCGDVKPESE